ncbi:hypothetical protein N656DRAFT_370830 [Canariomyces notabilis]|uniref:Uncharacterized protein n=1 Tax=Canariomyces notabilis TaxID=2074819 RepID=A0AAN6QF03_9PEZI|nr:hypothetical protein N656DRAFT_370830 [Canariomyces arenarius]
MVLRQIRVLARPGCARNINTSRSSPTSLSCTLDFFLHPSLFSFTRPLPPKNALITNAFLIAQSPSIYAVRHCFPGALLCVPAYSHYFTRLILQFQLESELHLR